MGRDGFQVYGGAGKALLFGALALLLLVTRKKSAAVRLKPWHWTQLIWLLPAAFAASTAWYGVDELIARQPGAWPLLTHACLLASVVFAAGATFGPANLRLLARTYRKEVLISLGLAIAFFGFLYAVYGLWKVLATIVLHSVRWLLGLLGLQSTIIMPRTLLFNKFGIDVAQYCSGIESIALFTSLYVLVGVLDWPRFNHRRFVAIFVPALAVLFGFNILRVAGLIAAGYYINPQIAFTLFHTYAGMVFFILYSIIFWSLGYKWMLRKN
ncbi:MAG TPA: archaeosortase/exosortase family protein [Candidatus Saccharimonadales bacterium]|nr:archaeosortase/exosortase family protein [Candidatus Saccharimonadales bacterium]